MSAAYQQDKWNNSSFLDKTKFFLPFKLVSNSWLGKRNVAAADLFCFGRRQYFLISWIILVHVYLDLPSRSEKLDFLE